MEGIDYDDTYCYNEKCGSYFASLDREGMNVPQDSTCQWAIFLLYNIRRDKNLHLQEVADVRISASSRCLQSS